MEINELLLRTAFSCMACDGDIATVEVCLIKHMANECHLFGDVDVDREHEKLVNEVKEQGNDFLKSFLSNLSEQSLTEEDEIKIASVAVQTILADNKVEYSEIKFFKIIRSYLKKVSDEVLMDKIDGIDENFLSPDIIADDVDVYDDYFATNNFELKDIFK